MFNRLPRAQALLDGRYRLQDLIGSGATAVVYRGLDERLGRPVAVKVLHPVLAHDPAYVQRFRQEAHRAAVVSHPHIAAVLDVGVDDTAAYIVMEYVDGTPISRLAPASIADVVVWGRQAADALGFLHGRQLVHGDVKPDNLLITGDGQLKLVDFGIARPVGTLERTTVLGSPSYLAPERLQGSALSPQADVYGLGATLFEALTGQPPFVGNTVDAVVTQVLAADPPPVTPLRPDTPPSLHAIVERALAKDPAQRFPDMAALGQALDALSHDAGRTTHVVPGVGAAPPPAPPALTMAPPPSPPPTVGAPPRASLTRRLAGGLAFLLLAAVTVLGLTLLRGGGPEARSAAGSEVVSTPAVEATAPPPPPTVLPATATPRPTVAPPTPTPAPPAPPAVALVTVPPVVGLPEKDAHKMLEAAGLRVGRNDKQPIVGVRKGTVMRQAPEAGQRVSHATEVNLVLAEELKPEPKAKGQGKGDD